MWDQENDQPMENDDAAAIIFQTVSVDLQKELSGIDSSIKRYVRLDPSY